MNRPNFIKSPFKCDFDLANPCDEEPSSILLNQLGTMKAAVYHALTLASRWRARDLRMGPGLDSCPTILLRVSVLVGRSTVCIPECAKENGEVFDNLISYGQIERPEPKAPWCKPTRR